MEFAFDKFLKMHYNIFILSGCKNDMEKVKTIIVGGGAAGLMAAVRLGEKAGHSVLLIERNERLGRKLSATGNGQGNVSNIHMSADHYNPSARSSVRSVLLRFGKDDLLRFFTKLGGLFVTDAEGRVYPASRQAASVTDLFRFALDRLSVGVRLGEKVLSAEKRGNAFFVRTDRSEYCCETLLLACGGKAAPHFGTDGNGYALARQFGHSVTELVPSLVQLKTEQPPIRGLKGTRCDCSVRLLCKKREVCRAEGDVIFTDYGVSGNAVFKVSPYWKECDAVSIDFLPDIDPSALVTLLHDKAGSFPSLRAEDLLRCIVNSAVGRSILRYCSVEPSLAAESIREKLPAVVDAIKNFEIRLTGSLGFDYAQVTKGGVTLSELDENLMSKKVKNLYLVGELTDVDGACGGYNLQWAFSSACVAAAAIASEGSCR